MNKIFKSIIITFSLLCATVLMLVGLTSCGGGSSAKTIKIDNTNAITAYLKETPAPVDSFRTTSELKEGNNFKCDYSFCYTYNNKNYIAVMYGYPEDCILNDDMLFVSATRVEGKSYYSIKNIYEPNNYTVKYYNGNTLIDTVELKTK